MPYHRIVVREMNILWRTRNIALIYLEAFLCQTIPMASLLARIPAVKRAIDLRSDTVIIHVL